MAGQFAKPRTSNWETTLDGQKVASYKGDSINGFDVSERKPDPHRCPAVNSLQPCRVV